MQFSYPLSVPIFYVTGTECGLPLGISTGKIKDLQLTSSSSSVPYPTHRGRLNSPSLWCADHKDQKPTFMVYHLMFKLGFFNVSIYAYI